MQKKNSLLGLHVYGDVDTVISSIVERAKGIKNKAFSDKELIAFRKSGENTILIPGRGQLNTITAGEALGFDDVGVREGVDLIFASSSGAAVGYYWVAGLREASDIFYKRNIENKLVSFFRNPMLDIGSLAKEMRFRYPVNPKIFQDKRNTRLIINVTDWRKGTNHFFEASQMEDPLSLVLTSMLMPVFSGFPRPKMNITIGGHTYVDGLMKPTLISDAIENGAKNILLLTINPLDYRIPYLNSIISIGKYLTKQKILAGAITEMLNYPKILDEEFTVLKKYLNKEILLPKGVSLAVIAPTKVPMHSGSMNGKILEQTQAEAQSFTKELLHSYI